MILKDQDHEALEESISHHELFGCSRNVSVVMQNTELSVPRDMGLQSDLQSHVCLQLSLLRVEYTMRVATTKRSRETLVPDFIDHFSK